MRRLLLSAALCALASAAFAQQAPLVPSTGPGIPAPPVVGNGTVWYAGSPNTTGAAGAAQAAGTIACMGVWLPVAQHWDRVGVNITTLGVGNIQIALYAGGIDGVTGKLQPQGAPLASSGNLVDTSTGNLTWTLTSQAVGPGVVFACTAYGDATVILTDTTATYQAGLVGSTTEANALSAAIKGYSYAGSFGTWPNFTGVALTDVTAATVVPTIAYRVSSVP